MADTLTYDKNNVYYVDPSDAFVQMDGENKHYVTPDTEDMCIAVDLEVECPKRYNRTNGLSKFILQWATSGGENTNFLGGTALDGEGTNTKLRYLTSDGNEYVYGDNQTQEMFGIKSIHIDYSTFFVPNITIEFSDVRGASLFTIEEANHQACTNGIQHSLNSVDVTRSFFECFFRFPYPKFRLKVKGLYGKPASYELTVAKCNHSLDATTGNYNVTATFIGYTYSLLNDITMNALIAAPDAQDWGVDYWTSNFSNRTLPDGSGTYKKISEMVAGMAGAARRADELDKQTQSNNESYNKRISDIVAMRDALTSICGPDGALAKFYSKGLSEQNELHIYPDNRRMLVVNGYSNTLLANVHAGRTTDKFKMKEDGSGPVEEDNTSETIKLRELYQAFNTAYKQYINDKASEDPDLQLDKFTQLGVGVHSCGSVYQVTAANGDGSRRDIRISDEATQKAVADLLSNSMVINTAIDSEFSFTKGGVIVDEDVETVLSYGTDTTMRYCTIDVFDYTEVFDKLNEVEQMLRNSLQAENEQVDLSGLYIDCLGFKPTIENIMAIVMAHFEVLLYGIKTCEDNVYSLLNSGNRKSTNLEAGATVPPMADGNVPPFPDVFTTDKYGKRIRTWIGASGINAAYAPEKELIETLLDAVDVVEEKITEAMRVETENTLANINSGVAEVPFPVSIIDFIKVRRPGEENEEDTLYSPFGRSISSVVNGKKEDRQKALANILKARWLNIGDSIEDESDTGKVDAHNFMIMHHGEISSLDTLLDTVSGIDGGKLSSLAGDVCVEVNNGKYIIPSVGYSLQDTSGDARNVNADDPASPYSTRYSLYQKGKKVKYWQRCYYKYDDYVESMHAALDALQISWDKPDFYGLPDSFKTDLWDVDENVWNILLNTSDASTGIINCPLGRNIHKIYDTNTNTLTKSVHSFSASVPIAYYKNAYISSLGYVFGSKEYYETTDIDKQAYLFLEQFKHSLVEYGDEDDNEYSSIKLFAGVLYDGCLAVRNGGDSALPIPNREFAKLYKQWRDNEFVRIKDVYELKHNGVRCTVEELSGLFNFIQENGTKEKFWDNSNAMDENYHSYSVIDISDVQDWVKYFVDVDRLKTVYGLHVSVYNGHCSKQLTINDSYINLYAKNRQEIIEASKKLLVPVIVFNKCYCKNTKKEDPNKYNLDDDYADGFITELRKLIEAEKGEIKAISAYNRALARANNAAAGEMEDDIRVTLYTYIKTIYDKWLCGNGDYPKKYGINDFFSKHFYFIDSFYNKIGDDLIVNIKHVLEDIDNSRRNKAMSLLEFITSVSSKNLVQTLCVQNFSDFSDSEHNILEQAFKPLAYNDASMDTVSSMPDFVFIYANQPSQHIDIKGDGEDEYEYENDGFHLSCDDSISDLCIEGKRQGKIPAFGVKYGTLYQHFFHDLQVGMDSSMATEQSMAAMFAIANINQNSDSGEIISPIGQDLYTIYSNNSYSCKLRMMGSAWVQPLMYFDLLNVPMFHGSYMIKKVTHNITPGDMVTEIVGVRQANVANKFVEHYMLSRRGTYIEERKAFEAKNAKPVNNCPYQMFDPRESDVGDEDNNHTTNIAVLKTLSTEHKGKNYTYYDIIVNQVLGATNAVGHLKSNESHYRTTIPLMAGVMYTRIKWYNKDMGGWSNVLKATDDFPYMYTTFQQGSIPDDVMKTYILEIEEVLNNSPVSLVGKKEGIRQAGREHTITARDLSIMTHYDFTLELANEYLFSYNGKVYLFGPFNNSGTAPCYEVGASDAVKRLRERSITNRTAEEESYSDIAVGLQRSIKKTCEKTDSLSQWNPKFIQGTDSDTFIIDNLVSQDMADTMFDMLLNTYYDYIIRLEYITGNQKQIRVSAANLVDGVGPRRIVRMIQSNGQIVEAGEGGSKEPFTEGFLNAIYKKYLVGVDLDKILTSNSNVFMKECENFYANITTERIKNLFGDIEIEPCEEYTIREYNTDMSNGGMHENEWASVNHTYKGINLDSCNDNCSNVNCRDSNDPLYPSIEVYQNMLNTIDSIVLVAKDWCSKNNCTLCISSFYRAPKRNRRVGGSVNSNHNKGYAVDLQVKKNGIINNDLTKSLFEYFKDLDKNKKTVTIDGNSFVFSVNELLYEHNSRGSKWIHVSHKPSGDKHTIKDNYQSKR